MSTQSPSSGHSRPLWQLLLAPMLILSAGFHVALLLLPTGASDEAAIPPPDPEIDTIAITRVPPRESTSPEAPATLSPSAVVGGPGAAPVAAAAVPAAPSSPRATSPASSSSAAPAASPNTATPSPRQPSSSRPGATPARRTNSRSGSRSGGGVPNLSNGTNRAASPVASPNPPAPRVSEPTLYTEPPSDAQLSAVRGSLSTATPDEARQGVIRDSLPESNRFEELVARLRLLLQQHYGTGENFNAQETTRRYYSNQSDSWLEQTARQLGVEEISSRDTSFFYRPDIILTVEREFCYSKAPADEAMVGFVLTPEGTVDGSPRVLRGTGYNSINEEVLEAVATNDFTAPEETTAHVVEVKVRVDYGQQRCS